jgi:hypothetical protein
MQVIVPCPDNEVDPVSHFSFHELQNRSDQIDRRVALVIPEPSMRTNERRIFGIFPAIWKKINFSKYFVVFHKSLFEAEKNPKSKERKKAWIKNASSSVSQETFKFNIYCNFFFVEHSRKEVLIKIYIFLLYCFENVWILPTMLQSNYFSISPWKIK